MDIFFISFRESNAEENWQRLLELHPYAKRLHGIKGIDQVHNACDTLSSSQYFWTVDGDNYLIEPLTRVDSFDSELVMFHSLDPIHLVPSLLGGVKFWKKGAMTKTMLHGDFCLNATRTKMISEFVYSETRYNSSEFDAWKAAFRHCVKLNSQIIGGRSSAKNKDRYLDLWKSCEHLDDGNNHAKWAYQGFLDAEKYAVDNRHDFETINKINDFDWLEIYFENLYSTFKTSR